MAIQTARGRLIGGGVLLLLTITIVGWWSFSNSPTALQSPPPEISIPASPPVATRPPDPPPPPEAVQVAPVEPATEPEPLAPQEPSQAMSPAEAKARETVAGYPAERERILAELEGQSLEETISQALHVWPSDAFTAGYSRGFFMGDRQKYLLQDPRLAKVLHAAVYGTEEERAAIQSQVMQIIENLLAERQKRDDGLEYDDYFVSTAPGREIYPLVLVELDTHGETLPLLLRWYDADRGPEWTEERLRALDEKIASLGGTPGRANDVVTGDILLIAAAAHRISSRLGDPLIELDGTESDPVDNSGPEFPGGRLDIPIIDELRGHLLFEQLMPYESDSIMDALRTRLQVRTSNQESTQ